MMTSESIAVLADQIAKGVHPSRCSHRIVRGYFVFLFAVEVTVDAMTVSYSIGSVSFEYLELIDALRPREKRKAIRKKIRDFREYVRGMQDVMEDGSDDDQ